MIKFPSHLFLETDVSLAGLSTFGIGGRGRFYVQVTNPEDLMTVVSWANSRHIPYFIIAGGSNIVFSDNGLDGLIIQINAGNIELIGENMSADAGVSLKDVINRAILTGLSGLESLSGIPGTVGGAVVGNAGAYGHSISEAVSSVEVWDGKKSFRLTHNECQFAYRESVFKHKKYIVLRVNLSFRTGKKDDLLNISREIISKREAKYKPGLKCPGSFFKNVLVQNLTSETLKKIDPRKIIDGKVPAGYLLDEIGARGTRIGGIEIASFHGNLFINNGAGTAKDVKTLAHVLKNKVQEKFGITLEEEIRYF